MNPTRRDALKFLTAGALLAPRLSLADDDTPRMLWGDTSRLGRPFSKDPSVIKIGEIYHLYFSLPPRTGDKAWGIGIATSKNLNDWQRLGEVPPVGEVETLGICAPCAVRLDGKIHLFYQTYGRGKDDAICHAVSDDGLSFERDPSNPVYHPTGPWTSGRAIDAEVVRFGDRTLMLAATRNPNMKIQMLVAAEATPGKGYGRDAWTPLHDGPVLKPELPWERNCIEAASVVVRGDKMFMFYAGGYNNEPQQIGCATSTDGIHWARLSDQPLLPNGPPGSWNSSESGHPGAFVDDDGRTYLFYQGNDDKGKTWRLSYVDIAWNDRGPIVKG